MVVSAQPVQGANADLLFGEFTTTCKEPLEQGKPLSFDKTALAPDVVRRYFSRLTARGNGVVLKTGTVNVLAIIPEEPNFCAFASKQPDFTPVGRAYAQWRRSLGSDYIESKPFEAHKYTKSSRILRASNTLIRAMEDGSYMYIFMQWNLSGDGTFLIQAGRGEENPIALKILEEAGN